MKIVNNLDQTLNGGFKGLYNEVVTEDCYKLRKINFTPSIIFDCGANIGIFTRYARSLFPDALIIAVEPNEENFAHLKKFTKDPNVIFINKAIGKGKIYRAKTAVNGSGECYLSEGLGYPAEIIQDDPGNLEPSFVKTITIDELLNEYYKPEMKSILKLDIEGAENSIWKDEKSMNALKQIDFITIELHFYAHVGGIVWQEVQDETHKALKSFEETHDCELNHIYFYGEKIIKL